MKKLILVIFTLFFCAASYSQITSHSKTISIPGSDSNTVTLDCRNTGDLIFYTPDDSTTIRCEIDTSYKAALVQKWADGTYSAGSLLASGTYAVKDESVKRIRFINMNAAAILIEIKYRCGY